MSFDTSFSLYFGIRFVQKSGVQISDYFYIQLPSLKVWCFLLNYLSIHFKQSMAINQNSMKLYSIILPITLMSFIIIYYKSSTMALNKQVLAMVLTTVLATGAIIYFSESLSNKEGDLKCTSRSTMISRGQAWVDKHVPYSQSKTYEGYRTDCSGFVSMCWELEKPGLTTFTMHTVSKQITKDELLHGDAMNNAQEHIVMFAGWSDSSKTHYVAMEEANTAEGTVKKVIPYPYFNNNHAFVPIRYHNVC